MPHFYFFFRNFLFKGSPVLNAQLCALTQLANCCDLQHKPNLGCTAIKAARLLSLAPLTEIKFQQFFSVLNLATGLVKIRTNKNIKIKNKDKCVAVL